MNPISNPSAWLDPCISIIGVLIQLIAIIIGIVIIFVQIKRNHQNSIELQKNNFQEELRLKIFNKIVEKIEAATIGVISSSTKVQGIPNTIDFFWKRQNEYNLKNIEPFKERAETLSKLHYEAKDLVFNLTSIIESHEIAFPSFRIFMDMIHYQIRVCDGAFDKFFREVLLYLPVDVPEKKQNKLGIEVINPYQPTPEKLTNLKRLANKYLNECIALQSYIIDLSIESQNSLLYNIFEYRVPIRKPKDPRLLVITTDPKKIKELRKYLKEKNIKE